MVNSQIAIIVEDGQIRNFKIVTLVVQLALEILSLIALAWLQMQRHNVSSIHVGDRFWDVIFRIPEQYQEPCSSRIILTSFQAQPISYHVISTTKKMIEHPLTVSVG